MSSLAAAQVVPIPEGATEAIPEGGGLESRSRGDIYSHLGLCLCSLLSHSAPCPRPFLLFLVSSSKAAPVVPIPEGATREIPEGDGLVSRLRALAHLETVQQLLTSKKHTQAEAQVFLFRYRSVE